MLDQAAFFLAGEVDQEELLLVLLDHFGSAEAPESTRIWFYRGGDRDTRLEIFLKNDGTIRAILPSTTFPGEELSQIRELVIGALKGEPGPAFGQKVGFCRGRVTGYFRYGDLFQILPVPEHAPQPTSGDFPFLFQYAYPSSPSWSIRQHRASRRSRQYVGLLNVLSNTRLHTGSRYTRFFWALHDNFISAWEQEGYSYEGLTGAIDGFSEPASITPIGRVNPSVYYDATGGGGPLSLPQDIEQALDVAFDLPGKRLRQLHHALLYLDASESVWEESKSLSYIALISALEALMETPAVEDCERCGQPMYRVTQRFREFLLRHVPGIESIPEWKMLYGVRSELSHGHDFMVRDTSSVISISRRLMVEENVERVLRQIAKVAIRDWLYWPLASDLP
jgi:hypothetical protein